MFVLCLCVFGAGVAALVYHVSTPVPAGFEHRQTLWLMFTVINALTQLMGFLEWLGICDRLAMMRKMKSKPKYAMPELLELVQTEDTEFDGVKVRISTPNSIQGQSNRPGIIFLHGGGWVLSSVETYDEFTRKIAVDVEAVVVSIEYRLAPDYPFPVPFEDCLTASKYFLRNTSHYNVDPNAVAIMGDSAGGNLAAAVALELRDEKFSPALKAQALIYPVTQALDLSLPSYQQNAKGPLVTKKMMGAFLAQYILGHDGKTYDISQKIASNKHASADIKKQMAKSKLSRSRLPEICLSDGARQPDISEGDEKLWNQMKDALLDQRFAPLLADDVKNLPAAFVFTAQYDVLRDEGIMYAERLREAGNDVAWCHSKNGFHGMIMPATLTTQPEVQRCYKEMIDFIK